MWQKWRYKGPLDIEIKPFCAVEPELDTIDEDDKEEDEVRRFLSSSVLAKLGASVRKMGIITLSCTATTPVPETVTIKPRDEVRRIHIVECRDSKFSDLELEDQDDSDGFWDYPASTEEESEYSKDNAPLSLTATLGKTNNAHDNKEYDWPPAVIADKDIPEIVNGGLFRFALEHPQHAPSWVFEDGYAHFLDTTRHERRIAKGKFKEVVPEHYIAGATLWYLKDDEDMMSLEELNASKQQAVEGTTTLGYTYTSKSGSSSSSARFRFSSSSLPVGSLPSSYRGVQAKRHHHLSANYYNLNCSGDPYQATTQKKYNELLAQIGSHPHTKPKDKSRAPPIPPRSPARGKPYTPAAQRGFFASLFSSSSSEVKTQQKIKPQQEMGDLWHDETSLAMLEGSIPAPKFNRGDYLRWRFKIDLPKLKK